MLTLKGSFNRRTSTVFVPISSNYPVLDFFIWNPSDEILMAFQVTVKQPLTSHPKIDGADDNCKSWLTFCSTQNPIEIYWIIPQTCVGKPMDFKDRVVLLQELSSDNDLPALQKFSLQ
jgi:hypothetical protein